jgi:hypothetical protein
MNLIDRDALTRRFQNYQRDCEKEGDQRAAEIFMDVLCEIADAPTIDPERHAQRKRLDEQENGFSHCCTECHNLVYEYDPYCATCGAKLDGEARG